jgi:hypothetical protein
MNETEESGWVLTTRLLKGFVSESRSDDARISNQNIGSSFAIPIAGSAILMLLIAIFYHEYCLRKHGLDTCLGYGRMNRRQTYLENDRALVEESRRRLNEEERGAERIVTNNELRLWYECFMKTFTTVSDREGYCGCSVLIHFQYVIVSNRLSNRRTWFSLVMALLPSANTIKTKN